MGEHSADYDARSWHAALDAVLDRADEGNEFGPANYVLVCRIVGDVRRAFPPGSAAS